MPLTRQDEQTHDIPATWSHRYRYWVAEPMIGAVEFFLFRLLQYLPIDLCSAIGARIGRYGREEQRMLSERARRALRHIFPRISRREHEDAILDRLRANAGRAFIESMIARRICDAGRIQVADLEPLRAALDSERPLIFVSVHTSNLGDLLGMLLMRLTGHKAVTTTRPFKNRFHQKLVEAMRRHPDLLILYPRVSSARQLIRHLSRPRHSALLHLDEARDRQVRFPLFERNVAGPSNLMLAIRLAEHTGALIVPVHMRRQSGARFSVHFSAPISPHDPAFADQQDGSERRAAVARMLDAHFEDVIRASIDDWLQIYYVRH